MTREEKIAYWLDLADYDIGTAEGLFSVKRWLYVGFMCHQVIEKTLKAYWCKTQDDNPPPTYIIWHNCRYAVDCTSKCHRSNNIRWPF